MAVDLTEVSAFDAVVTVPQPGDLRKAASVVLFAQQLADRTRYLYNSSRQNVYDVSRAPYGAVGDAAADDTTAIQDAIDDASAATGGGIVYLPGAHRLTATLVVPPHVDLLGTPGVSSLAIDHASARILSYTTGTASGAPSRVTGISFTAQQVNSGAAIYNDAATIANVVVEFCTFNTGTNAHGLAFDFAGASVLSVEHCMIGVHAFAGVLSAVGTFGVTRLVGNRIVANAIANSSTLFFTAGANHRFSVRDNFFDCTALTGGGPLAIASNQGFTLVEGCHFKGSGAAVLTAYGVSANTVFTERNNTYASSTTALFFALAGVFADGSRLDITKHLRAAGVGTTYTWPDDVETLELEGASTVPTITLPQMVTRGRRIRLLIKNLSGSAWGAITLTGAVFLTNTPALNLANGETGVIDLEVATIIPPNTPAWTITHRGP